MYKINKNNVYRWESESSVGGKIRVILQIENVPMASWHKLSFYKKRKQKVWNTLISYGVSAAVTGCCYEINHTHTPETIVGRLIITFHPLKDQISNLNALLEIEGKKELFEMFFGLAYWLRGVYDLYFNQPPGGD